MKQKATAIAIAIAFAACFMWAGYVLGHVVAAKQAVAQKSILI